MDEAQGHCTITAHGQAARTWAARILMDFPETIVQPLLGIEPQSDPGAAGIGFVLPSWGLLSSWTIWQLDRKFCYGLFVENILQYIRISRLETGLRAPAS